MRKFLESNKKAYIYILVDPLDNSIQYVGCSTLIKDRLSKHVYEAKHYKNIKYSKKNLWIIDLLNKGEKPILQIIEEIICDQWEEREKYWIAYYGLNNLLNILPGGFSTKGYIPPELYCLGKVASNETKEKQRMAKMGKKQKESQIYNRIINFIGNKRNGKYTSKYVGVYWDKTANKWRSEIKFNKKRIYIGIFDNEDDAALAYNRKAVELYGKNISINIVDKE